MNKIALLVIAMSLLGCASSLPPVEKVIYVTTPLSLPNKPALPTWTSADMQCLSTDMKQKILERDRVRKSYSEELEVIIKSTSK